MSRADLLKKYRAVLLGVGVWAHNTAGDLIRYYLLVGVCVVRRRFFIRSAKLVPSIWLSSVRGVFPAS